MLFRSIGDPVSWLSWLGRGFGRLELDEARWVMVDVESTGLNVGTDALLAIAAVAMQVDWSRKRLSMRPSDSFEVLLRQKDILSTKENIMLHGIGVQAQQQGLVPADAMRAFCTFVGKSPLLAFHAAFDRSLINKQLHALGLPRLRSPWVDVEHLCEVTHGNVKARSLDEWMAHFAIDCTHRHQAASDAFAQCEVLQRIWPVVREQCKGWAGLQRLASQRRWLAT